METIKLTTREIGRDVSFGHDGHYFTGKVTAVDDGGFDIHVPGEATFSFNSHNPVVKGNPKDAKFRDIVLLPTEEERQEMVAKEFLAFLAKEGVVLAQRPEDDPLNPVEVEDPMKLIAKFVKDSM